MGRSFQGSIRGTMSLRIPLLHLMRSFLWLYLPMVLQEVAWTCWPINPTSMIWPPMVSWLSLQNLASWVATLPRMSASNCRQRQDACHGPMVRNGRRLFTRTRARLAMLAKSHLLIGRLSLIGTQGSVLLGTVWVERWLRKWAAAPLRRSTM